MVEFFKHYLTSKDFMIGSAVGTGSTYLTVTYWPLVSDLLSAILAFIPG